MATHKMDSEKSVYLDREEHSHKGLVGAKNIVVYTYDSGTDTLIPVNSDNPLPTSATLAGNVTAGTEYTDGAATPANPVGGIPVFDDAGTITAVSDTNPLPVSATVSTAGLATDTNQTDGSQKSQIVDAGGDAATVTGGKLDVNASIDTTGLATDATDTSTASIDTKMTTLNAKDFATQTTLATRLSESDFDTKTGGLTEAAPATDTASSGLNGRLQRIAQRITTFIGQLPSALGQTTKSGSLSVTLASDQDALPITDNGGSVTVDGTVVVTGVSTAAKQDTGNTSLSSIDGKITAVNTGAVVVSSSALPSGAATAAKQPALGTAGTASADVITVQGKASMTPLLTDGSATTQPVSGTVSVTGVSTSTKQSDGSQKTQVVDGSGNVIGATSNALDVNIKSGAAAGTQYTEDAASAADPVGNALIGRRRDTLSATEVSADGDNIALNATNKGQLHVKLADTVTVDGSGVTQPVSNANLDVALSTRLKPADTLTKVSTVDTITNVVHVDDNSGSLTVDAASLPLPTGAATSTKQSDGSQKTQVVDGSGNVIGATANALDVNIKSGSSAVSTSGNITGTTSVTLTLSNSTTVAVQITGTFVATMIAERSVDGTNYTTAYGYQNANESSYQKSGFTAADVNNIWTFDAAGSTKFRIRCTAFTSGTAVVNLVGVTSANQITESFSYIIGQAANLGVNANQAGSWTVTANAGTNLNTSALALDATLAGAIKAEDVQAADGDKGIPALSVRKNTAASTSGSDGDYQPLITNTTGHLWVDASGQTLTVGSHAVTNAGTFAVQATLAAETTKVIGTVRNSDGAGNLWTSNSTTYTAKFGQDSNLLGTLGTAFSTAGKVDVKGADGDVFVRQATASNLNATVVGTGTFAVQAAQSGTWTVQPGNTANTTAWLTKEQASTAAVTSVASSATSVSLLASSATRRAATFYNDSTQILYLKLGTTASNTSYTIQIAAAGYYELPQPCYTGAIDGIWSSSNGNVRITEVTT